MILEEIIRFTIPGSTVIVALLIAFWPFVKHQVDVGAGAIIVVLAAMLVLPIGYLAHQIYMIWLESKCGRLASFKRPALQLMKQKYEASKEGTKIQSWQVWLAWDYWFRLCASEALRNHFIRFGYWWLSFKSMTVACSIGFFSLLLSILLCYRPASWSLTDSCHFSARLLFSGLYLFLVIFFCLKAKSTGNYFWLLERCAVESNWEQIEPLLDRIVKESPGIPYSVGWWGRTVQGLPERKSPPKRGTE